MFARERWRRPGLQSLHHYPITHAYMHRAYKRKLNTHQCTQIRHTHARTHTPATFSVWLSLACCVDGVKWIHPDRLWGVFVWICIWFVGIKCVALPSGEIGWRFFDRFLLTSQKSQHLNKTMLLLSYTWIIFEILKTWDKECRRLPSAS